MANYWACTSDRVRGFAAHAGGPPPAACLGSREAWIAHDRSDPTVDVLYGEQARAAWQAENGCTQETEPFSPGPCERYACDDAQMVWCEDDTSALVAHSWPQWASPSLWAFFEAI